jgi:hypothetical protein
MPNYTARIWIRRVEIKFHTFLTPVAEVSAPAPYDLLQVHKNQLAISVADTVPLNKKLYLFLKYEDRSVLSL